MLSPSAPLTPEQINQSSLDDLYQYANQRYWGGDLPGGVPISWNSNIVRVLGRAKYRADSVNRRHEIELSTLLKNDPEKIMNVLVHEQIHVWQHEMYHRTDDQSYCDEKIAKNGRSAGHIKGHARYFFAQKHRLESRFPELTISTRDDFDPLESGVDVGQNYGAVLEFRDGGKTVSRVVWSDRNFMNDLGGLGEALSQIHGVTKVLKLTPFVTTDPRVIQATKLTQSGLPKKGTKPSIHIDEFVDSLLNYEGTEVLHDRAIDLASLRPEVDPDFLAALDGVKSYKGNPFNVYLGLALRVMHTKQGKNFDSHNPELDSDHIISGRSTFLSADQVQFALDEWKSAGARELFRKDTAMNRRLTKLVSQISPNGISPKGFRQAIFAAWVEAGGHVRMPWSDKTRETFRKEVLKSAKSRWSKFRSSAESEEIVNWIFDAGMTLKPKQIDSPEQLVKLMTPSFAHYSKEGFKSKMAVECVNFGLEPREPKLPELAEKAWESCTIEAAVPFSGQELFHRLSRRFHSERRGGRVHDASDMILEIQDYAKLFAKRKAGCPSDEGAYKLIQMFEEDEVLNIATTDAREFREDREIIETFTQRLKDELGYTPSSPEAKPQPESPKAETPTPERGSNFSFPF